LSFPNWYIEQVLDEEQSDLTRTLSTLRKDYKTMDAALKRIQGKSKQAGQQFLFESFPRWYIGWLLVQTKFDETQCWKALQKSQKTLELLRNMERDADQSLLQWLFEQGGCQVRGRDTEGRPVIWLRKFDDQGKISFPYTEHLLHVVWVTTWVMRAMKPDLVDRGLLVVLSIRDLSLQSINPVLEGKLAGMMSSLFPVSNPGGKNCIYYRNSLVNQKQEQIVDRFLARSPDGASFFHLVTSDGQDILDLLQDPRDVPSTFFESGKAVSFDMATYGNYQELINRAGFHRIELEDLWFPGSQRSSKRVERPEYVRKASTEYMEPEIQFEIKNSICSETLIRCKSRSVGRM